MVYEKKSLLLLVTNMLSVDLTCSSIYLYTCE